MWDSSTTTTALRSGATATQDADVSTPGQGAKVARVDEQAGGDILSLIPDQKLLNGADAAYPVFIDPTWNPHYATGSRQHYVETQQGCSTAKNYDSTQYGDPGVGYNSWSGCIGGERSYFQLGVPSAIWGTHIVSATINVKENYSASCSLSANVALYWSGSISSGTTDQTDSTTPTISYVGAEGVVGIPDPTSVQDPPTLQLSAATAPADFDAGDHVNLSVNGYTAISNAFDLAGLGPDAS
jgi:hypothetical protein